MDKEVGRPMIVSFFNFFPKKDFGLGGKKVWGEFSLVQNQVLMQVASTVFDSDFLDWGRSDG